MRSVLQYELGLAAGRITRLKQHPQAVLVNGVPARTVDPLHAGDVLTVDVGDLRPGVPMEPAEGKLDVLYEDADLLILNKPAGLATHGKGEREPNLARLATAYLGSESVFHPVNRLDRGTSGVLCAAKTGYVHDRLRRLLHSPEFTREYLAVAMGEVRPLAGVIELPIAKFADKKFGVRPDGAPCVTRYRVLGSDGAVSLLRIRPETGRTHQIRVHFSAIGHPLLGDRLYGGASQELYRPALHAAAVALIHPITGAQVSAEAPLPPDMAECIERHGLTTFL